MNKTNIAIITKVEGTLRVHYCLGYLPTTKWLQDQLK